MKLDRKAGFYILILAILAFFIMFYITSNFNMPSLGQLLFWSILTIIVETLLIMLPNNEVGVSVGSAINLASIIVGGLMLGTMSASIGLLLRIPYVPGYGRQHLFNTPFYITVYNISQSIIVTGIMGLIYVYTGGIIGELSFLQALLVLIIGTLINTSIISGLMSILKKENFKKVWKTNINGVIWNALAVGTMGIIIALAYVSYGYGAVLLFFGPLLLARYSFKLYMEMRGLYLSTIKTLSKTIEAKDPYTSGHANRVMEYSVLLAEALELSYEKIQDIRMAAILHDLGKIAINDDILNKGGKLTAEEYEQIMKHPIIGAEIIDNISFLRDVKEIIKYHHERYDGKGYPEGLEGDEIPLEACILAIADSYDAMTSDRPYRKALDKEVALQEIKNNAGTQFHPYLAEIFVKKMTEQGG